MKTHLILFIFIGFFCTAKSQINMADSTVQAITYWGLNESENYRISQKNLHSVNGEITKNDSTSFDVKVTVIDSTENSYTIMWEFSNYTIPFLGLVPDLKKSMESKKFIYKTNELGEMQELLNWEEIRDNMIETTKISTELALKGAMDTLSASAKDSLSKFMGAALKPLQSKSYIETKAIEHVALFHSFMGGKYKLGEVIETETETPNNLNPNENFNSQVQLWLDYISEEDNFYTFRYNQSVDGEQLLKFIKVFLSSISSKFGEGFGDTEEFENATMDYSTTNYTAMDDWGWPLYIEHIVNVDFGVYKRTITTTIEILD